MMATVDTQVSERELYERHSEVLRVISNPLRHEILHLLAEADRTASELVELTGASKSNVSQHLSLLKAYGLVESAREGRSIMLHLAYPQLAQACAIIDDILRDQAQRGLSLLESCGT